MAEITLDMADTGRSRRAAPGDLVIVRLEETPTSGYRWEVGAFDPAVLEPEGDDFAPSTGAGIGGGGTREFRFRVVGLGADTLSLVRRRAWEPDTQPVEAFEATVQAELTRPTRGRQHAGQ